MSINIGEYKSKFVIFGSGYDNVRADSGDGMTSFMYSCDYAAFDKTGSYLWVVTKTGPVADRKIRKIDTTTWEEVHHPWEDMDLSGVTVGGMLAYVESANSNLGILTLGDTMHTVVFDLTTDEVYCTVYGNLWRMSDGYHLRATEVDGIVRVIGATVTGGMNNAGFAVIDIANETYGLNAVAGGWTINSFYNDTDIVLANRNYGDRKATWGARITEGLNPTQLWWIADYIENVTLDSFASNDKLFFPTKTVGDMWQYGKYNVPPDISTPSPITVFGLNANTLATPACYTRGRTWASFRTTDNALVVTDFVNSGILYTGDSPSLTPIAMGDDLIVCAGSDGYTYLARYR